MFDKHITKIFNGRRRRRKQPESQQRDSIPWRFVFIVAAILFFIYALSLPDQPRRMIYYRPGPIHSPYP
jgi:hypothetical protein